MISILNAANLSFMNRNFSFCEFPYANLSDSCCIYSLFNYCNMYGVELYRTDLSDCSFEKANLDNIKIGLRPMMIGHTNWVYSACSSNDNKLLVSGSYDMLVMLWEIETGNLIKKFEGHKDKVCTVSFNIENKFIVSGSHDRTIKIWNVETGKEIKTLSGHSDYVRSISLSRDSKYIASGSGDKTVRIWDFL